MGLVYYVYVYVYYVYVYVYYVYVYVYYVSVYVYGIRSINYQSIHFWNFMVNTFPEKKLQIKREKYCKRFVTNYLIA